MTHDPSKADGRVETRRFANLTFDRFREMASDDNLKPSERIGYPEAMRRGFEPAILSDITSKLPALAGEQKTVLDIGIGCGELAEHIIGHCAAHRHRLILVDSDEMLARLPDAPHLVKVPGRFPDTVLDSLSALMPLGADAVICYGVLQVVFLDANPFQFVDQAAQLLAPGGALLFGEIPNHSKLRRFLASEAGHQFHRQYMRSDEPPVVPPFEVAHERIDDGVLLGLMARLRNAGFDAHVVPQAAGLPFSNRREDLLVQRP